MKELAKVHLTKDVKVDNQTLLGYLSTKTEWSEIKTIKMDCTMLEMNTAQLKIKWWLKNGTFMKTI